MKWPGNFLALLVCACTIILTFVAASVLDIVIAVISARFYTSLTFIVLFGVAGIFAAALGYMTSISYVRQKNETARWTLILFILGSGLLFFFWLSRIEGGEYEAAFKSYGATMALASLLFSRGKVI